MRVGYLNKKKILKFHTADLFYFPEVYELHLFWFRMSIPEAQNAHLSIKNVPFWKLFNSWYWTSRIGPEFLVLGDLQIIGKNVKLITR